MWGLDKQIIVRTKRVIYLSENIADLLNEILEEIEYIGGYDSIRKDHEFIVNGDIPTND